MRARFVVSELGADTDKLHADLLKPIEDAKADLVFLVGPSMRSLWDVLPASRRGAWAESSAGIVAPLSKALGKGDVVLVKGSNASKLSVVIDALKARAGA